MVKKRRSFAKSISWRILATTTTMVIVFIITGNIAISISIGAFETMAKLLIYYGHERMWARIDWGRE